MDIQTPIQSLGGWFKRNAKGLEKLGITKIEDFFYHVPSRYEDYSLISEIRIIQPGEIVTIQGTIIEFKNEFTKNWKRLQKAKIADESGEIDVIWFNQPYLANVIKKGDRISMSGKVGFFLHKLVLESPEYEVLQPGIPTIHTGRLVPVYPETRGISSKWLRRQIYNLIAKGGNNLLEYIPDSIINSEGLMEIKTAIKEVHFPSSKESAKNARKRLEFNELFLIHLSGLQKRKLWEKNITGNPFSVAKFQKKIENFWENLPFTLTNAQKKAVSDIFSDLSSKKIMNRLLEGDVGSGKTVVSAIAMYLSFLNGFQSVFMAPTEILAQQHYATINNLLSSLGVKVALATGSKKSIKYKNGKLDTDILIGTHAVLSKNINFDNLGLVIIDEQQRFGVEQRAFIRQKGKNPHLLTMTATPIPRTVALTLYGDLDVSYLDEMPKGRKIVKTWLVPEEKRENAYEWIKKQIKKNGDQAFIVCPFIEESESMQTVKAAKKEFEKLQKQIFPDLKLGLLHGKLKSKEKDEILEKFKNQETDILIATPVVEVGIDIPNATIILIEAAERFGLSQLHQLRGRVGRGNKQSYCLLFTDASNPQILTRLKAMETMHVGSELAELDLKLRGPGDMYGTAQHGTRSLKIASFYDFPLIEKTRIKAEAIFKKLNEYPMLRNKLKNVYGKEVSPD